MALALVPHLAAQDERRDAPATLWVRRVEFEGNHSVWRAALRAVVRTRPGKPLSKETVERDRVAVLRLYHREGLPFAHVEAVLNDVPGDRVDVTFRVAEGRRGRLERVSIAGNTAFSDAVLTAVSGLRPARFFGLASPGDYVPGSVDAALSNIREFYRSRGFFDVQVELEDVILDARKERIAVEARVVEGQRYRLVGVEVRGQQIYSEPFLLDKIALRTGVPYSGPDVEAAAKRLLDWYLAATDLLPTIREHSRYGEENEVTVIFDVTEGRHLFVGRVDVYGNDRTRDRVIRQRLKTIPGSRFLPDDLQESAVSLRRTGLFSDLEVRGTPSEEDENVYDIEVNVAEQEYYRWFYLLGDASSGAGAGAGVRILLSNLDLFNPPTDLDRLDHAFIGGGQLFQLEALPGSKESYFRFLFREPYFFSSSRALTLRAGTEIQEREVYEENRLLADAELRQFVDVDHHLSLALAYRVENVKVEDLEAGAPPDVVQAAGSTFLAYPRLSLRYDDTEVSFYSGPKGLRSEATLDLADSATGSSLDFSRLRLRADLFLPLFESHPDFRHTLQVGGELGWNEGLDDDPLPIFERYFIGGPRTFRGFDYRRLGPHQGDVPVGGQAMLRGTVQYSFPLYFKEIRGVALFDWGNLEPSFDNFSTGRFRTAVGGGLRVRLPVPLFEQPIPFNLYWVKALSSENGDEEEIFTFSLGFGF
ncbi:MAG: outer membrane protein assembly factor BamA [Planctomycetota bacterium]|nr:outer membrane protein assembly factor BamA [Planctomycetota bacterium]